MSNRAENRIKKFQNSICQVRPSQDMGAKNSTFWNMNKIAENERKLALKSGRKNKK